MTSPFTVPVILTTGSLYFAQVAEDATVGNVIDILLEQDQCKAEALEGLSDQGWALQTIRNERHGRRWDDEALEALGDGKYLVLNTVSVLMFWQVLSRHLPPLHLCWRRHPPTRRSNVPFPSFLSQAIYMILFFVWSPFIHLYRSMFPFSECQKYPTISVTRSSYPGPKLSPM